MKKLTKVKNMGRFDIGETYRYNTSHTFREYLAGFITLAVCIALALLISMVTVD